MQPKPAGLAPNYGAQFQDSAVIDAYPTRPPYPAAVFPLLADLITGQPRAVLDIGCGSGDLARRLAPLVDRVDAVDISTGMIALGKSLPGGDAPNLRWIVGALEDAPLMAPYALVTAAESLHWMEWSVVLPRLHAALVPGGYLAIVERGEVNPPWRPALMDLIHRYSTNHDYQPYDLIAELEARQLFTTVGRRETTPEPFTQSIDTYVESLHSRNGFSRDRMPAEDAAALDQALHDLLTPYAHAGQLYLHISAEIIWGLPAPASPELPRP